MNRSAVSPENDARSAVAAAAIAGLMLTVRAGAGELLEPRPDRDGDDDPLAVGEPRQLEP
jgi:hypothetical protein